MLLALRAQLDLLNTLHTEGTPETCSDFVSRGALALGTSPDERYLSRIDDAAVALIKAIGAATGGGQPIQPPSEDDWTRLAAFFLDNGGTPEELDIVANADGRDGRLCSATLRFFKAVVEVQGDVGRRIRAEMVYSLATS